MKKRPLTAWRAQNANSLMNDWLKTRGPAFRTGLDSGLRGVAASGWGFGTGQSNPVVEIDRAKSGWLAGSSNYKVPKLSDLA